MCLTIKQQVDLNNFWFITFQCITNNGQACTKFPYPASILRLSIECQKDGQNPVFTCFMLKTTGKAGFTFEKKHL